MKITPKIEKAVKTASHYHRGQVRKGGASLPYISHLFSVAALLSEYVDEEEDVIIAGLLHDTLEDTIYERGALERDFGSRVLAIVEEVTETKEDSMGRKISWKKRKEEALGKARTASAEGLVVKTADHTHNLENILQDFMERGPGVLKNFRAPLSEILWYHRTLLTILEERLNSPIVSRYRVAVERAEKELKEI